MNKIIKKNGFHRFSMDNGFVAFRDEDNDQVYVDPTSSETQCMIEVAGKRYRGRMWGFKGVSEESKQKISEIMNSREFYLDTELKQVSSIDRSYITLQESGEDLSIPCWIVRIRLHGLLHCVCIPNKSKPGKKATRGLYMGERVNSCWCPYDFHRLYVWEWPAADEKVTDSEMENILSKVCDVLFGDSKE